MDICTNQKVTTLDFFLSLILIFKGLKRDTLQSLADNQQFGFTCFWIERRKEN